MCNCGKNIQLVVNKSIGYGRRNRTKQKQLNFSDNFLRIFRILFFIITFASIERRSKMKRILGALFFIYLCASCSEGSKGELAFEVHDKYSKEKPVVQKKSLGQASHIFWVNKDVARVLRGLTLTIKCRVQIKEDGSLSILEYEKEQPYTVEKALKKYLKTFRVSQEALKQGNPKAGEAVVFLRYVVLR